MRGLGDMDYGRCGWLCIARSDMVYGCFKWLRVVMEWTNMGDRSFW